MGWKVEQWSSSMCLSRPKPLERDETVIDFAAAQRRRDKIFLVSLSSVERELVEQIMRDTLGRSAADAFRDLVDRKRKEKTETRLE
jgi:hypothetical protein